VTTQQFTLRENARYDSNQNQLPVLPTALDAFSCPTSPCLPPQASLTAARLIQWRVAPDLHTPTVYAGGIQVERQLPYRISMFAGLFMIQIQHVIRPRDLNAPIPGSITETNPLGIRPYGNVGDIYQSESSATLNQRQFFIGFNSRLNPRISLFSNYSMSFSHNDADGQGSAGFSANPYDQHGEYGRGGFDIRHRLFIGGTINLPWWKLALNPLIFAQSGAPFNILTGADTNLDGQFSERPSFAPSNAVCSGPGKTANIVCTRFGNFNVQPVTGEALIPRNYGTSPGYFVVNLGLSKTFNFGTIHSAHSATNSAPKGAGSGPSATPGKAPAAGGAQAKPGAGIPGLGPGGLGGGGGAREAKRYALQLSVQAANLFNHVNFRPLEGNLSSPFFGQSLGLNPFGGGNAGLGSAGAGNRRITLRARLSF
jgi:hypothetical protein